MWILYDRSSQMENLHLSGIWQHVLSKMNIKNTCFMMRLDYVSILYQHSRFDC